jgi:CRP/FNR family transcriptional regulator, cyclic AMP receptor protein
MLRAGLNACIQAVPVNGTKRGRATEFTEGLTADERAAFEERGRRRRWPRGAAIFNEGGRSEYVALLLDGRAKASYFTDAGNEVILAVRGPGSLLGEMSAIDEEPLSATVTALEAVEAVVVPVDSFLDYLERHPRVALMLLKTLSRRLRDADRKRIEFSAYDALGRVARRLVELADEFGEADGEAVRISLPLSQEELASWTGSSREAVSKALRALRGRGWIETHRRAITILDVESLRRRSE